MATLSTALLRSIAVAWEKQYATGVNSGIIGDVAHAIEGGYHISIQDQPSTNYSVTRPDDKAPPGTWPRNQSAAIDQSMARADMIICYKRVHAVWASKTDTRRKFFNAFNVWDGTGDAVRLDFVTSASGFANSTHTWHTHGELRRRYVNDPQAGRAWLSMTGGQTHAKWVAQEAPPPLKEDALSLLLIQEKDKPAVYVTDGLNVRWLTSGAALNAVKPLAINSGKITTITAGKLSDYGVPIGPMPE